MQRHRFEATSTQTLRRKRFEARASFRRNHFELTSTQGQRPRNHFEATSTQLTHATGLGRASHTMRAQSGARTTMRAQRGASTRRADEAKHARAQSRARTSTRKQSKTSTRAATHTRKARRAHATVIVTSFIIMRKREGCARAPQITRFILPRKADSKYGPSSSQIPPLLATEFKRACGAPFTRSRARIPYLLPSHAHSILASIPRAHSILASISRPFHPRFYPTRIPSLLSRAFHPRFHPARAIDYKARALRPMHEKRL